MFTFTAMPLPRRICPTKRRLRAMCRTPDVPPRKCLVKEEDCDSDASDANNGDPME